MDFLAAIFHRVVEGELGDAGRSFLGDDFQAFDDAGNDFVLQAGVEIFRIFAHDHDIDAIEARLHAGQIPHRAQVGVKIERLAQSDVDARSAASDGGAHGTLQRDFIAADGLESAFVEQRSRIGDPVLRAT